MSNRRLHIDTQMQVAKLYEEDALVKSYLVSTAMNGLGCTEGSYCTPSGKLRVAQKIGAEMPIGTVFRARIPSGEIWSLNPSNSLASSAEDLVLTRILWLEGTEDSNANTLNRYIYLHGTNQENLLGTPSSHGCIRFSNMDIVEVFEHLPLGSTVEVT